VPSSIHESPPFPGFSDEGLAFLRALPDHNNRDWFEERRPVYEDEVRQPLKLLIVDVARRFRDTDLPLTGDPTTSRFRIYRDLRFTDDDRPYKTNVGAVFSRSGEKTDDGVIYVHVEPGHCFLGGGFYQPSVSYLRPLRRAMAEAPDRFYDLLDTMAARDLPVTSMGDTLTGMPQGFHAYRDDDIAEHLKWKHLVVRRFCDDADLQAPAFAETVVEFAEACRPLLAYGWAEESEAAAD
jgi:uncharacterized protein (TIGR02453 family)